VGLEHSAIVKVEPAPESGVAFVACQKSCDGHQFAENQELLIVL
jgi:intracellular sulfur oxidation DsrE/DsrF family protein